MDSGILSLKESDADRVQREVAESVEYWRKKIYQDEGQMLEFKESLLVPILSKENENALKKMEPKIKDEFLKKKHKAIKHSAFKTLCAFANTTGGTLLLGVKDDKTISGLEIDFESLKEKNRDGFGKRFDDEVKTYFGESFSSLLFKEFLKFPEGDILIITVTASAEEVFMFKDEDGKDVEELYIRKLSSSEQLKGRELAKFIKRKHIEQFAKLNNDKVML